MIRRHAHLTTAALLVLSIALSGFDQTHNPAKRAAGVAELRVK